MDHTEVGGGLADGLVDGAEVGGGLTDGLVDGTEVGLSDASGHSSGSGGQSQFSLK